MTYFAVRLARGALLGLERLHVVATRLGHGVGAGMQHPMFNEPLALAPLPRALLRLPIIEDLHVVRFGLVVRQTQGDRLVLALAPSIARDPGAGACAAVVAEAKAFRDFDEVGRRCAAQPRPARSGFRATLCGPNGPSASPISPTFLQKPGANRPGR